MIHCVLEGSFRTDIGNMQFAETVRKGPAVALLEEWAPVEDTMDKGKSSLLSKNRVIPGDEV